METTFSLCHKEISAIWVHRTVDSERMGKNITKKSWCNHSDITQNRDKRNKKKVLRIKGTLYNYSNGSSKYQCHKRQKCPGTYLD